jgi:hypothetical protein
LQSVYEISASDCSFKYGDFQVSETFTFQLDFASIIRSPYLGDIPTSELDKFYQSRLEINQLRLRFREDVYRYICRTIDLNFTWTDGMDSSFVFRNDEEYFRSTEQLLRSKLRIESELLAITLFSENEMIAELFIGSPQIEHDYFLNFK